MIEMNCPHCGHALRIAEEHRGKRGTCRACGGEIQAVAEGEAAAETAPIENLQDVGIVEVGTYGKAADEAWIDPADQAAQARETTRQEAAVGPPEVPEEILKKHQARSAKRNRLIALAIVSVVSLTALICVLAFVLTQIARRVL